MRISKAPFGTFAGRQVDLFTLENDNGMTVKITNYGGTVTSIVVPDRDGKKEDVAYGFDTLDGYFGDEYKANSPYFGCIVGRYAGRVKDGKFNVQGNEFEVAKNADTNHIHGGVVGFDKQVWDAEALDSDGDCCLRLTLVSPDGDEGYPGTLKVAVEYRLTNANELRIHYSSETDKTTPLALTNHTYFNLNAFADKILDHTAQIHADRYLAVDDTLVPTGEQTPVAGTVCDFNSPKRIGDAFTELPTGFEHFYALDNPERTLNKVAAFSDPASGRTLEIETTEPGMLFYTGLYTSDELRRESGAQFGQYRAFCCEAAKWPNGPNIDAPNCVLQPGETLDETTVFRLGW